MVINRVIGGVMIASCCASGLSSEAAPPTGDDEARLAVGNAEEALRYFENPRLQLLEDAPEPDVVDLVQAVLGGECGCWLMNGSNASWMGGNVGIGTANPGAAMLRVEGSVAQPAATIFGNNLAADGWGVYGRANGPQGTGVLGIGRIGTQGWSQTPGGFGVFGFNSASTGISAGVFGQVISNNAYAGYFVGGKNYFGGPVGLGNFAPAEMLEIGDTNNSQDTYLQITTSGGNLYRAGVKLRHFSDTNGFTIVSDEGAGPNGLHIIDHPKEVTRLFIENSSGNVGVGTTSPAHKLDVAGNVKVRTNDQFYFGAVGENTDTVFFQRLHNGTNLTFLDLYIGDDPSGDVDWFRVLNTTGTPNTFWFGSHGFAFKPGGGDWADSSDERLKRDITSLQGSLDKLLELRGVTFYYTDLNAPGAAEGLQTGFVAQEVERVFPEWVIEMRDMGEKYEGYKALQLNGFEALAVEALRELRAEKDSQIAVIHVELASVREQSKSRIAALEDENADLRDRLDRLEAMMLEMSNR